LQAIGIPFPKLPELDKDDVKAVRSFLPGKLLGRCAALLALATLVLGFAGLVDQGLKRLLDADLSSTPWLRYTVLFGLPLFAVASQLVVEWRAERARHTLQRLALQPGIEQSGYFRIGPYLSTAEDRIKFDRADRAHEKVLSWIERSSSLPLYLTGDSGSGKSSLINAFVLPALRDHGWTVVEARTWQDPETALRTALINLSGTRRSRQAQERGLRNLLTAATRAAGTHLLLVLDQFEEFLILGKPDQQQRFATLIGDLHADPIRGLSLLLVLRSDYQILLDDVGLPPLRQGDNFYQVGRFTRAAAAGFMERSGLRLQADTLDRLLTSAAELDETAGLVRPITLNVIGYVLATGKTVAMSADAGELVRSYIELTIGQPAIRDFAPRVLEQLVTEQGTKQPRTESGLAVAANLRRGEVRAVLNGLGEAGLARPLDPINGVWELSHDFIARAVTRYLGRCGPERLQHAAFYAAPALFAIAMMVAAGALAWHRFSPYEIRSELAMLGLTVTDSRDGLTAESTSLLTPKAFLLSGPLLAKLPLRTLIVHETQVANLTNLEPLKGLTTLQSIDLTGTVADLEPLKGLTALQSLNLTRARVANLAPLTGLTALQSLDLSGTQVVNLEPLKGLTALRSLELAETQVANLAPLKDLTALQWLNLTGTKVANLEPLKGLTALQYLNLYGTQVANLEPLKDLTALQSLDLNLTQVANLEPLKDLTALQYLNLFGTQVANLEPLKGLTALRSLYLYRTKVPNLEPLKGLTALQIFH
jgi:hypothetical protein